MTTEAIAKEKDRDSTKLRIQILKQTYLLVDIIIGLKEASRLAKDTKFGHKRRDLVKIPKTAQMTKGTHKKADK